MLKKSLNNETNTDCQQLWTEALQLLQLARTKKKTAKKLDGRKHVENGNNTETADDPKIRKRTLERLHWKS